MIKPSTFLVHVIRPTQAIMGKHHPPFNTSAAEKLLFGTAMAESHLNRLRQDPGGPAMSFYQMEPSTHDWLISDYLVRRPSYAEAVLDASNCRELGLRFLIPNLAYATAMARINYWRIPGSALKDDVEWLARYWKEHWNTEDGAGRPSQFIDAFEEFWPGLRA